MHAKKKNLLQSAFHQRFKQFLATWMPCTACKWNQEKLWNQIEHFLCSAVEWLLLLSLLLVMSLGSLLWSFELKKEYCGSSLIFLPYNIQFNFCISEQHPFECTVHFVTATIWSKFIQIFELIYPTLNRNHSYPIVWFAKLWEKTN